MAEEKKDVLRRKWRWPEVRDWGVPFTRDWVNSMLTGIAGLDDEKSAREIMSQPALSCAKSFMDHLCKEHGYKLDSGDLEAFIASFDAHIRESRFAPGCEERDGAIYVVYPPLKEAKTDCACPLVFNEIIELVPTQCLCSAGMHRHVFEYVTKKPVEVEILEAVGRGGEKCAFKIKVKKKGER